PITRPRSRAGTTVIRVVMSSGIITAVPDAWMIRAASNTGKAGATTASAVPMLNTVMAVANAVRVVTRWRNQPVTGITEAIVSMNAVESDCAATSSICSPSISWGIAFIMIVSLRMTTKAAATSHITTGGVRRFAADAGIGIVAPLSGDGE